jgi:hypothetical protein
MTYQELRQRADQVRAIPLAVVLRASGAEPDRRDKAKWHTPRGVLSVTGAKFFNWNQSRGGGGAIDLVMHLEQVPFKDAVQWLWHHGPIAPCPPPTPPPAPDDLKLPRQDPAQLCTVKRYLERDRGIPASVLEPLIEAGRLYADHRANAVFPLLGKEDRAVGAELRGTGPCRWRGLAAGSRRDLGYFSVQASQTAAIVLCESAIDTISCLVLYPDRRCISTAGARPNPAWLGPMLRQGQPVYCGFDSDTTGHTMAAAMIARHPSIHRLSPPAHDWNDVLTSRL